MVREDANSRECFGRAGRSPRLPPIFATKSSAPRESARISILGLIANGQDQTARTNFADILDQIERVAVCKVEIQNRHVGLQRAEAGRGRPSLRAPHKYQFRALENTPRRSGPRALTPRPRGHVPVSVPDNERTPFWPPSFRNRSICNSWARLPGARQSAPTLYQEQQSTKTIGTM